MGTGSYLTPYFEADISGGNDSHAYHYNPQHVAMAKNNPYIVAVITDDVGYGSWQEIFKAYAYTGVINSQDRRLLPWNCFPGKFGFVANDRLLVSNKDASLIFGNARTQTTILDTNTYMPKEVIGSDFPEGLNVDHGNYYNAIYSPDGVYALHHNARVGINRNVIAKAIITDTGISYQELGNVDIGFTVSEVVNGAWFTSDNTGLIVIKDSQLKRYKTDITGNSGFELVETISFVSENILAQPDGTAFYGLKVEDGKATISAYRQLKDGTAIVGIMWRGKKYFELTPELFDATPLDVRSGKTFVGSKGIVEVGAAIIAESGEV